LCAKGYFERIRGESSTQGFAMPYWSIRFIFCSGFIADALLECVSANDRADPVFRRLYKLVPEPGAAFACPYCGMLLGFDDDGQPQAPESGWRVFRYSQVELEAKKIEDGELPSTPLVDWARKHRFMSPGSHQPFTDYIYAEQAPSNELVP
jgi:hypothetical protein